MKKSPGKTPLNAWFGGRLASDRGAFGSLGKVMVSLGQFFFGSPVAEKDLYGS